MECPAMSFGMLAVAAVAAVAVVAGLAGLAGLLLALPDRLRIPVVVGELLAGVVLGPNRCRSVGSPQVVAGTGAGRWRPGWSACPPRHEPPFLQVRDIRPKSPHNYRDPKQSPGAQRRVSCLV
jgi:hypothetical protein